MKPLTWLSARSRAQMIDTSHHVELPIHFFCPFRIQVSPSRLAVVVSPPAVPEPTRGSVSPKQPIFSIRAIGGGPLCFFASAPSEEEEPHAHPSLTPHKSTEQGARPPISIPTQPT